MLESGFALEQCGQDVEQRLRPASQFREGQLDQQVRGNQRAVKVHYER